MSSQNIELFEVGDIIVWTKEAESSLPIRVSQSRILKLQMKVTKLGRSLSDAHPQDLAINLPEGKIPFAWFSGKWFIKQKPAA